MLLSLLKILFFFAVVLAVALGAVHLSESGQSLRLEFAGSEYMLGPLQMLVAVVLLMIAGWVVLRALGLIIAFLRFLAGDETAINRYFARSRERKGYEALGEGMLAVASGEGRLAMSKAAKAEKYLDRPHITNLLAAQAAEVAGDSSRAGEIYRKLLDDERTRFVGVRGLMRQMLAEGDTKTALLLAQKAYALKPRHTEIQDTLLQLQTQEGDWHGARAVLKDKRKRGDLPKDVHIRRDAVLALQEASEVLAHGSSISAREAAISANRASPDLIPAAVLAARSYIAQKDFRNAARVLEKTWSVRPHPDVAAAYAEIAPDETSDARLKRFQTLIRKNPDHEESRLLSAELLLATEDFPAARRALGDLAEVHPTVRTLSIMAAVERGEGADEAVVRGWLARALTASRGPQWCCDKCQNVMLNWSPVCDSCGGFDTLTWREPDERHNGAAPAGAEMLPLLIGPGAAKPPAPTPQDITPEPTPMVVPEAAEPSATVKTAPEPKSPPASTVESQPKHVKGEVPNVAPGMVPREDDYVRVAPSATVTTPSPQPQPQPRPAAPAEPLTTEAEPAPAAAPTPQARPEPTPSNDEMREPQPIRTAEFDIPEHEYQALSRGEKASPNLGATTSDGRRG
ncbi:MAG: heme biosynthesis HemY N-terminal domain-containing protein [Paracoccus sp. (in: a-proteobacteria)]|uniref:heme biosynthesis HemY N-terminal domain-containing protein n=1 Tax=Paracoccus sp. TaxID=267 RepID=UPI0026DF313E|nr:heme biosynthesis HemY N-terminal domain-containing protein [Paracoccus sp. (in: a-proteobacteria)]MDO5632462.1 heme biosynthesis HemY N-terminal domain-containing protein [Paracoccus sp. (in: a-proteobacteria)]